MKITIEISPKELNDTLVSLAMGAVQGLTQGVDDPELQEILSSALKRPEEGTEFQPSGEDKPAAFDVVEGGLAEGAMEIGATGPMGAVGVNSKVQELPAPTNGPRDTSKLPEINPDRRAEAWAKFRDTVRLWTLNFGQTHEIEVERKEVVRDEDGNPVDLEGNPIPRGKKPVYKTVKVMETKPKEQPNRQAALAALGSGHYTLPILVMAYEEGSLQGLVEKALKQLPDDGYEAWRPFADQGYESWIDYVEQISNTMVQVSHAAFPDLAGTLDYSTKWRRSRA